MNVSAGGLQDNNLKFTVDNCNVYVLFSNNEQYSYDFNSSKFNLTTTSTNSTFEIKFSKVDAAPVSWEDNITIYIPKKNYNLITGISNKGGLSLPSVNADIVVTNNSGAVSLILPSNYNRTLTYSSIKGSGSLKLNNNFNFTINSKSKCSSASVPTNWPIFRNGNHDYNYTSGNGTAKINVNLTNSSFAFNK